MLLGMGAGFVFTTPASAAAETENAVSTGEGGQNIGLSTGEIFVNNLSVVVVILLGAAVMSLPSIGLLGFNGYVLGSLAAQASASGELSVFVTLLLVHGVFELPALWVAGAVSLRATAALYWHLSGRKESLVTDAELAELGRLLVVCVALLAIAAVVESQVSFRLAVVLASG